MKVVDETTPQDATQVRKPATAQRTVTAVPEAASILDMLQGFNVPSKMTEAGRRYSEQLKDMVMMDKICKDVVPITTDRFECQIYRSINGEFGIPIVFAESCQKINIDVPITEKVMEIAEMIYSTHGTKLLEFIIVSPVDYDRVHKMASHISATLKMASDTRYSNITVANIAGTDFVVSTNIGEVRAYIDSRSPHAIPARDDIGLLVYAINGKSKRPVNFYNGRPDQDAVPILAVTGYTEFLSTTGSSFGHTKAQYYPIVTVTNIVTDLVSPKLTGMALAIATDAFIKQYRWLAPYSSFSKDAPNLGALVTTDQGTPYFVENIDQRNELLQSCILLPGLALDITEGRARIAGIDKFIYDTQGAMKDIMDFLNIKGGDFGGNPVIRRWKEYIGSVKYEGQAVDTRNIDYLRLATKIKEVGKINKFLFRSEKPEERVQQIREVIGQDIDVLYTNIHSVLDSGLVNVISQHLQNSLSLVYDQPMMGSATNISDIINGNVNNFNTFNPLSRGMNNMWNPNNSRNPYSWQ